MDLFIVESPHKAGVIQGYLDKEKYKVVSSKGHIRDLEERDMSIDIDNNFTPRYVVSPDKKALVKELSQLASKAETVWLASDPDREGEAIAWHLAEQLNLSPSQAKRITYNEITKNAVLDAMQHPREIDMDLVNAQQARRVLDRLVGFELSPVLWRKIKRGLSAGRVQSATLRLVVDREREIAAFKPKPYYKVEGCFVIDGTKVKGNLDTRFESTDQARAFLQDSIGASYSVADIQKENGSRFPAAPFTTSTLQQEAARKLHLSSSRTMSIAQKLYEHGLITYMRTDSTNLSSLALGTIKKFVCEGFGPEYSHPRNFKTKVRGAQEAHEAIRPTDVRRTSIEGTADEQKLYALIWKRAVASQMADASVLNTTITLGGSTRSEKFLVKSARIIFDGFLKLYSEGTDDAAEDDALPTVLPDIAAGTAAACSSISAECKFTLPPARYSEPLLIKKMEELGIGRPSTYAPTISTLTKERGYIVVADKKGTDVEVTNLSLRGGVISESLHTESVGAEKRRLVPSEVGTMVIDYLSGSFSDILDSDFTAKVEESFDIIAEGKQEWTGMIGGFYAPFHEKVNAALADREYHKVEREIGTDPADGKKIVARFGPYGPYVQKGEPSEKLFANLPSDTLIENVTLEEALKLFALPRKVGQWEGVDIIATKGRFGPYIKYGSKNVSLPRGADPLKISLEECVKAIENEASKSAIGEPIREFPSGISILNGRYGAYIKASGKNYRIPAGKKAEALSEDDCKAIISAAPEPGAAPRKFYRKKKQ